MIPQAARFQSRAPENGSHFSLSEIYSLTAQWFDGLRRAANPFGGVKDSGYARFGSKAALEEFIELRWITIRRTQAHYPI
jgi:hypothetical protein